nr:hypothetical protein [Kibdelosporangium sp. MJ126-NF4]CEL16669.1 hypothetical protein [Kibdelosporangium sp. MJ126-NF4]CTQ88979.1 hypothetical protein [Kibdelosporangium sp. MJ126-NF4]
MRELRSELEAYAAKDEPPMRLAFDDVMTVAKRRRQRRRSTVVATGVAVVAAVGIAVPTLLVTPSSPTGAASSSVADCMSEPERALQLACVARVSVQPHLGSLKLESPRLDAQRLQVTPVQQPQSNTAVDALAPIEHIELPVSDGKEVVGIVTVQISRDQPGACPEFCTPLPSTEGRQLFLSRTPPENPAVIAYSDGYRVLVRSNRHDRADAVSRGKFTPLLTVDAMIQIATTPELRP